MVTLNPKNRSQLAQTVFSIGYHYVEKLHDLGKAKQFLWEAWKLDWTNLDLAKTYMLRGILKIQHGLKS